jgi:iron complex outermembrane receptor protein
VLNANAIADRNALALPDIFNYVVGATQSQQNINGFSFRGFANTGSYTQNIQFDGLMGATLKKGASSSANVESLEFLKGPNGVLYGQMNPGGLLNIVSKSPKVTRQTVLRATVGTFAGEFDNPGDKFTGTVTFDTTGPVDGNRRLLYRLILDTASQPSSRPGNYDRAYSIYPSLTYQWSRETYVTVKFERSADNRRQDDNLIPIFTNNTAYGPTATWYTARYNTVYQDHKDKARDAGEAAAVLLHAQLPGEWMFRLQTRSVWHTDFVREFTVNNANVYSPSSTFAKPTSVLRRQYNQVVNGHRYNFFDANLLRAFGPETFRHTILAGVGGGGEFFGNHRYAFGPNLPVTQAITLIDPVLDQSAWPADGTGTQAQKTYQTMLGEYITDQMKLGSRFHVSAGVRHDHQLVHGIDTFNPARTPYFSQQTNSNTAQLGAVVDVTKNVSAYTSWSESVKPPATIAVDQYGNSSFPPEKGEQYEAGLKFDTPSRAFFVSAALYQIDRTNVLVASGTNLPSGQAISRIDGKQQSRGMELEAQWQPFPHWQMQAGFAYSKAVIKESSKNPQTIGLDLANAPRKTGNFWTRYNVPSGQWKGLGLGVGVIYVGQAWAGDPTTTVYYRLPGWTRVDTAVYYKWRRYDFALNVQNALDRRYIASAQSAITVNPGEERKITFSATTKF